MSSTSENDKIPDGKRRLIDAALRLAGRDGVPLSALGTRELAREAGLNHNTLYRHFRDSSELGQAVAEQVAEHIMAGMKEVRRRSQRHADATQGAVKYFLDFARDNPHFFSVGLRELHSAGTPTRAMLLRVLESMAQESVEQIVSMDLVPGVERETLHRICLDMIYYMFYRALDCIEQPQRRTQIAQQMVDFIRLQFFGAMSSRKQQAEQSEPRTRARGGA
jgi:TetR/AcrR family transcriptional regulator, fatty acid biosynthesis regulator